MTHTPGPWKAKQSSPQFAEFQIVAGKDEIAIVYDNNGDDEPTKFPGEANARLIAAAPDLLAALKMMLDDWDSSPNLCQRVARGAVAKAAGTSDEGKP